MSASSFELVFSSLTAESAVTSVRAEKARDQAIDILRGLAVIGVVYVHGWGLLTKGAKPFIPADWFRYDVGSFIAIAAYLTCQSSSSRSLPYKAAVVRRLSRLWLPFLVWSLLYFACLADVRTLTPTKVLTRHFLGYGWAGQYYFLILFQLAFLQPLFRYIRISTRALIGVYAAGAAGLILLHCHVPGSEFALKIAERPVIYWAPFVALGIWLSQHRDAFEERFAAVSSQVIATVCLAASCAPLIQDHFFPHDRVTETLVHLRSSNLIGSTAVLLGGWLLARRGAFGIFQGPLRVLGRYVLGIFCLNSLVIVGLQRALAARSFAGAMPGWFAPLSPLVTIPLVLTLCLLCSAAIEAIGGRRLVK